MAKLVLDPHVGFSILATTGSERERHEELGCGLQGPGSRPVRRALAELKQRIAALGRDAAIEQAEELLRWLDDRPAYRGLCEDRHVAGRRVLKESVLYPDPAGQIPATLHVRRGLEALEIDLPLHAWAPLADTLAAIAAGESAAKIRRGVRLPELQELFGELEAAGLLVEGEPLPPPPRQPGVLFVGHNTALVSSATTRILLDPWLRPWHGQDPADYRMLLPHQLLPVDAVLLTHSHGDHFHLGSLLHLPRSTPIVVPWLARENVLSTDLAFRLGQLGFTRVLTPRWWESLRFGDVEVQVLPFLGEQATATALVYPEVRNAGNTYAIRTPELSAAFLADTGHDPLGHMTDVAAEARERFGPVDLLFGGMRAFRIHPVLYPFTTLDAFLLNVPLELAGVQQQLMNDAGELLDTAARFGAPFVVPYADGGAPWYWREGMGPAYRGYPAYEGFREAPENAIEDEQSDPFPERLAEVAAQRPAGGPEALVLRPGDDLRLEGGRPHIRRHPGHAWPWSEDPRG